jgi:hypothetical protein
MPRSVAGAGRRNLTLKGLGIAGLGAHLDEGLSAIRTTTEKINLVSALEKRGQKKGVREPIGNLPSVLP